MPFRRLKSTVRVLTPPRDAPREAPTPLAFVSASNWDLSSRKQMSDVAIHLAGKGFTCIDCDLCLPDSWAILNNSQSLLGHFESEFLSCLSRYSSSPFPPIIFARSAGTLIAQTYISSNRASGLFLISPPPSNNHVPSHLLPTPLEEFTYEMKFPIAITGTPDEMEAVEQHRDLKTGYVSVYLDEVMDESSIFETAQMWLDELGV